MIEKPKQANLFTEIADDFHHMSSETYTALKNWAHGLKQDANTDFDKVWDELYKKLQADLEDDKKKQAQKAKTTPTKKDQGCPPVSYGYNLDWKLL